MCSLFYRSNLMRCKTGYKERGFGDEEWEAQLLICVLLQQMVPAALASSGCCSIRESRRSFEVCTCGLESKHCLRHRSNCVWWAVYVWGPGEVRRCTSHHSGRVAVIDLEAGHGFDDGHHRLDGVTVDHRSVLLTLVLWVAVFMDDPENVCKKVQPVAHFS